MTAIAMNVLLHQLQEIVPAFNVASVPKDATGAYASPVHNNKNLLVNLCLLCCNFLNHVTVIFNKKND
jgi:hypothetical protein